METSLKPVQLENLIVDTINESMTGNIGTAIVKFRDKGNFNHAPEMVELNNQLIKIELDARKAMKAAIREYLAK